MEVSKIENQLHRTTSLSQSYGEWPPTYEESVIDEIDSHLLATLTRVDWPSFKKAADLACGAGRTGLWLKNHGVEQVDGLDITPAMLEVAARKRVYTRLVYGDMRTTMLENMSYDLVTSVLADEYIPDLKPLYGEVARILRPDGFYIDLGFHQHFLLSGSLPGQTESGSTIKYVHLVSEHFRAAVAAGFELVEINERVVDASWAARHPEWLKHLEKPISYVLVWKKRQTPAF